MDVRRWTLILAAWLLASAMPASAPAGSLPAPETKPTALHAEAFGAWFEAARAGRLDVPPVATEAAKKYQYVFVGGFGNEVAQGYFLQNARDLGRRGVPEAQIHFVFPSSHVTLAENAPLVRKEIERLAAARPEPLVVIAHSRGACDALAFALRHPRFVRERVALMFLVQGPFGGTAAADYVVGEGPPLGKGDGLRPRHRAVASLLSRIERNQLRKGQHGGIVDLTRDGSRQFWTEALAEHAEAVAMIGPKVVFVATTAPPGRQGPLRQAAARYVAASDGPNDGLIAVADQFIGGLGTVVILDDVAHTDMTNRFPLGRASRRLRTALVDGILMCLAGSRVTDPEVIPTRHVVPASPRRGDRRR